MAAWLRRARRRSRERRHPGARQPCLTRSTAVTGGTPSGPTGPTASGTSSAAGSGGLRPGAARPLPGSQFRARSGAPRGYSPSSAVAKSAALNGRRSSSVSPTPISLIGSPSSCAIAIAMPPFAVPSSFVRATPVSRHGAAEQPRLLQAVLARRRVDHQQRLVRRARAAAARSRAAPWRAPPSGSSACAAGRRCR